MNIGLQPQYPTLWTVCGVLIGLVLVGILVEASMAGYRKRKKAKLQQEMEEARAAWESRVESQKKELALVRKVSPDSISLWETDEPRFDFNMRRLEAEPTPVGAIISLFSGIALFCVALATILVCVPFNSKYYNFYVEKGKVGQVISTITVGKDSVGTYTFTLEGNPRPYTIDDPRIKTLQGEDVTLLCSVGWNNLAADTWSCNLRDYAGSTR